MFGDGFFSLTLKQGCCRATAHILICIMYVRAPARSRSIRGSLTRPNGRLGVLLGGGRVKRVLVRFFPLTLKRGCCRATTHILICIMYVRAPARSRSIRGSLTRPNGRLGVLLGGGRVKRVLVRFFPLTLKRGCCRATTHILICIMYVRAPA